MSDLNSISSSSKKSEAEEVNEASKVDYSKIDNHALGELDRITKKIVDKEPFEKEDNETTENKTELIKSGLLDNYHNFYINFFLYLKDLFNTHLLGGYDSRTQELLKIKHFIFNYTSKTLDSANNTRQETYEYPVATININDVRPFASAGQIMRQKIQTSSTHRIPLIINDTKREMITTTLVQNFINVSVEIKFQTSADIINYLNHINNIFPQNFTVYTPKYFNLLNVTNFVENWDDTDDLVGPSILLTKPNNTYFDALYKYAYLNIEPNCELTSIQQMIDKDSMNYSLNLDFIFTASQPIDLRKSKTYNYKSIVIDINVETSAGLSINDPLISQVENETITNELKRLKLTNYQIQNKIQAIYSNDRPKVKFWTSSDIFKDTNYKYFISDTKNIYSLNYLITKIKLIQLDTFDNDLISEKLNIIENTVDEDQLIKFEFQDSNKKLFYAISKYLPSAEADKLSFSILILKGFPE